MKKLLALMLALVFTFAVVGCGGAGNDKDGDSSKGNGSGNGTSQSGSSDKESSQSGSSDKESSNPIVGAWHHERTDDEPVDMLLTLKEDGTGAIGRNNLTPVTWEENDDETITITINFSQGDPKVTTAHLTDDGDLFWDYSFKVKTNSGDIVELDNLTFEKE